MLYAVERYCTPTAVGPTVLPSIEGFLTVVAAGGPPLLLLCGVVLCVVRWRRALSLPQITIVFIRGLVFSLGNTRNYYSLSRYLPVL